MGPLHIPSFTGPFLLQDPLTQSAGEFVSGGESFFFFFVFCHFRAIPAAYGGSQARGLIGVVASGLHHSHSNVRSEPRL